MELHRTFASAAPSGVLGQMIEEFGMAVEIATLSISLFIAGYIVGPLFWGPVSEQVRRSVLPLIASLTKIPFKIGRRPVFVVSFLFYTVSLKPFTGEMETHDGCFRAFKSDALFLITLARYWFFDSSAAVSQLPH